jgi:hypothetical protein
MVGQIANSVHALQAIVIPGRRAAANPESIFQKPVFMDSGSRPWGGPGMTE